MVTVASSWLFLGFATDAYTCTCSIKNDYFACTVNNG